MTHQFGGKSFSSGISRVEHHSFRNFDTVLLLDEVEKKTYRTTEEVIYMEEKSKNYQPRHIRSLIVATHGMYIILHSLYSFVEQGI